ncbi:MAG: acyl-CoA reductase [Bacteroidetes bacterium]|nr:MAG: acyl-CoA reductase [Bacteroidota bacterium]
MNISQRIEAFALLGDFLSQFSNNTKNENCSKINNKYYTDFDFILSDVQSQNQWFTHKHTTYAISAFADLLTKKNLSKWVDNYQNINNSNTNKTIGVIMAGNIPLVGFHDMLCVLISGHKFLGKMSSKDDQLLKKIADILITINPEFNKLITFTNKLSNFDAAIATGSNNTSRYFESYFKNCPHIIRKNRNSIAILNGNETENELAELADDIFLYFGLGCRNVSKLFVPKAYNFNKFINSINHYKDIINHKKYSNNYKYYKSILKINNTQHIDNGFLLIKEDFTISSPISNLYYEEYNNINSLKNYIEQNSESIQCIVSKHDEFKNAIKFGQAQKPELWDYADNIDTLEFLSQIN